MVAQRERRFPQQDRHSSAHSSPIPRCKLTWRPSVHSTKPFVPPLNITPSRPRELPDYPSLRASREHILIVRPRRARRMVWLLSIPPFRACSPSLLEGGLFGLPLRVAFSPAHPLARRDVPLARARAFRFSPLCPKGSSQTALHCAHRTSDFSALYPYPARRLVWSPLRASSDHRFIVGALRAQRPYQLSRHSPSELACLSLHGVAWSILKCARRTSTFLSCAFREQEDDQATLSSLLIFVA